MIILTNVNVDANFNSIMTQSVKKKVSVMSVKVKKKWNLLYKVEFPYYLEVSRDFFAPFFADNNTKYQIHNTQCETNATRPNNIFEQYVNIFSQLDFEFHCSLVFCIVILNIFCILYTNP